MKMPALKLVRRRTSSSMLTHWGVGLQERKVEVCRHNYICKDKHSHEHNVTTVTRLVLHPLVLGCTVFDAPNREPRSSPKQGCSGLPAHFQRPRGDAGIFALPKAGKQNDYKFVQQLLFQALRRHTNTFRPSSSLSETTSKPHPLPPVSSVHPQCYGCYTGGFGVR